MRGLAGLQRSSSLGGSGATTGGGSGAVAGGGLLGEVCSPPPSKPLNFAVPAAAAQLSSPFAAAATVTPVPPRLHGPQQTAPAGHSQRQAGAMDDDSDWSAGEEMEDQENRQPCGAPTAGTAGATQPPAATWLFSPVRPRAAPRGGSSSTAEPGGAAGGAAGLFSPPAHMPTPAREVGPAAPAALPTLQHAPSFSSWMFSAARPPPSSSAAAGPVDVADVVETLTAGGCLAQSGAACTGCKGLGEAACMALTPSQLRHVTPSLHLSSWPCPRLPCPPLHPADPTAPRGFGSGGPGGGQAGAPSHLDRLLAELGDTHYPRSCELVLAVVNGRVLRLGGAQLRATELASHGTHIGTCLAGLVAAGPPAKVVCAASSPRLPLCRPAVMQWEQEELPDSDADAEQV